jgi:CRISPR system Cascade subunit CasC
MLIQIHMLQNYSPANLNRDDTGAPKDVIFGGVRRGRISSQCLKRSIRRSTAFSEAFAKDDLLGIRTRKLPSLIKEELAKLKVSDAELQAILVRIPEIGRESTKGIKKEEATEETTEGVTAEKAEAHEIETQVKQLIFIGKNEVKPMAEKLLAIYRRLGEKGWKKTKISEITKELGSSLPKSVDIAMFGRMTTSEAFENVDAAVQVAHAISTNALNQEFDYFTAVDDLSDEPGAEMIGDIEFNSSTYYKYLNIHWEELVKNLGGDVVVAKKAVAALINAAATSQPTGKQNTFAAFNLPDLVLVEVSDRNLPVSYTNAFIKPAKANAEYSLMGASIRQLADYMEKVVSKYSLTSDRAFLSIEETNLHGAENKGSLDELIKWVEQKLPAAG